MANISKNIKQIRIKNNMTQEELAEALFVTRQTISNTVICFHHLKIFLNVLLFFPLWLRIFYLNFPLLMSIIYKLLLYLRVFQHF